MRLPDNRRLSPQHEIGGYATPCLTTPFTTAMLLSVHESSNLGIVLPYARPHQSDPHPDSPNYVIGASGSTQKSMLLKGQFHGPL
jgi:hypothetical protein